jgi:preprotein translocase subunit YajC
VAQDVGSGIIPLDCVGIGGQAIVLIPEKASMRMAIRETENVMGEDSGLIFWGILLVAMVFFMFLPQWTARRRQKRREEELEVGQRVVTIGGLIGDLTALDFDARIARLKIADGIEISILPGAIRGRYEAIDGEQARAEEGGVPDSDTTV